MSEERAHRLPKDSHRLLSATPDAAGPPSEKRDRIGLKEMQTPFARAKRR